MQVKDYLRMPFEFQIFRDGFVLVLKDAKKLELKAHSDCSICDCDCCFFFAYNGVQSCTLY